MSRKRVDETKEEECGLENVIFPSHPEFWTSFYDPRSRPNVYEWYGLSSILIQKLGMHLQQSLRSPREPCLQIGCGNSLLDRALIHGGYCQSIISVDACKEAILQQLEIHPFVSKESSFEASKCRLLACSSSPTDNEETSEEIDCESVADSCRSLFHSYESTSVTGRKRFSVSPADGTAEDWCSYLTVELISNPSHQVPLCDNATTVEDANSIVRTGQRIFVVRNISRRTKRQNFRARKRTSGPNETSSSPLHFPLGLAADWCQRWEEEIVDSSACSGKEPLRSRMALSLFCCSDATRLQGIPDSTFGAVIDKGTFDALMSVSDACTSRSWNLVTEIARVLRPGGVYLCVSGHEVEYSQPIFESLSSLWVVERETISLSTIKGDCLSLWVCTRHENIPHSS